MQSFSTISKNSIDAEQGIKENIISHFEAQVKQVPDKEALVFHGKKWTYKQLDAISNQLARYLVKEYQVAKGDIVGIITEKSDLTVISMLAVLKAGGAFVPIDSDSPKQRVRHIVGDTQMKVLLLQSSKMFDFTELDCPLFALDLQLETLETKSQSLNIEVSSSDLAYVIYTSGTTGLPKGVMIEAGAINNYSQFVINQFKLSQEDKTIVLSSLAFDLGYTGLFGSLISGGTLHLTKDDFGKNPDGVFNYIIEEGITYLKTTPSLFFIFTHLPAFKQRANELSLRLILLGGESINCEDIETYWEQKPDTQFVNHYGPTETTVGTVFHQVEKEKFGAYKKQPTIGKPIDNNKVVIMDKNQQLSPVGISGEICVGGKGLARGYLNNPELTHEKFFMAGSKNNVRLYKTGDFGKWLTSGSLAFMGRRDNQIKIKGYRVELEEVNNALLSLDDIVDAKVVVRKDSNGQPYLVAYYIAAEENPGIKSNLTQILPDYMVPGAFVYLKEFPLTTNGKLDEKALPDPIKSEAQQALKQPATPLEGKLQRIWKEVLGKKDVGVDQSFFEVGGDSIKAIQVASKAYEIKYKLEVKDIFQFPTIEELAAEIRPLEQVADQAPVSGVFPLTPIQKRFFEGKVNNKNHYNQSVMLFSEEGYDIENTKLVFEKILQHHDNLRTVFRKNEEGQYEGVINETVGLSIDQTDLRDKDEARKALVDKANELQASLDVEKGPLFKVHIFKLEDGDRLLLVAHHLLVDGVSWRILFEDIGKLYKSVNNDEDLALPDKTHSFKEWSEKLNTYANSEAFKREHSFWTAFNKADIKPIPIKGKGVNNAIKDINKVTFSLSAEHTKTLLNEVNWLYKTSVKDILLTALGLAVSKTFKLNKVLIEQEGHGREEIIDEVDISRTVGWFTSKYPVLIDLSHSDDLGRSIVEVKEHLRKVPYNGIGYGLLKYLADSEKSEVLNHPEPQISFNYLGQFDSDIEKSSFSIAKEPAGNQMSINEPRPYDIDITGMVAGEQLSISISYGVEQFDASTIEHFSENFENALQEINKLSNANSSQNLTPSDYLYKNLSIDKLEQLQKEYEIEDIYPLSPMQQGLFYHTLLEPTSTAYYNQTSYRINGDLNPGLVEESFNRLFARHDVFRAVFLHKDLIEPIQVILKERKVDFSFIDFSHLKSNDDKVYELNKFKKEDRKRLIDLSKDVLLRVVIIKLSDDEYELVWNDHHILKDGWSTGIIMSEFLQTYYSLLQGKEPQLSEAKPYKNYLQWLSKLDEQETRQYWKEFLEGYDTQRGTSVLKNKADIVGYEKKERNIVLSEDKTEKLEEQARKLNVTLNTLIQAIWGVLLSKYNGTDDMVFGNVVSGRPAEIPGVQSMIGLFINTIPVRVRYDQSASFESVVKELQVEAGKSAPHHYLSLAQIQSCSALKQNLLDHVLIFDNYPVASKIEGVESKNAKEVKIPRVKSIAINDHAHYDFSIVIGPSSKLSIKFDYNALAFEQDVIDGLATSITKLIDQVIQNPQSSVEELSLVDFDDISRFYSTYNHKEERQIDSSFIELFERQVARVPNNVALTFGDKKLSYLEISAQVNKLANYLKSNYDVGEGDAVGIMIDTSEWVIISMLGIMKAGAYFVPVDVEAPLARRKFIVDDADLKLLILQSDLLFSVAEEELNCGLCAIDIQLEDGSISSESLPYKVNADLPAYAIYTSGTTGVPKGVQVSHKSLVNYVKWFIDITDFDSQESGLLLTSHVFDLGFTTIFGCLASGADLHLPKNNVGKQPETVLKYIAEQQISFVKLTPSIFYMLTNLPAFIKGEVSLSLNWVFIGGEKIKPADLLKFNEKCPYTHLVNHYGPTETTIGVIAHMIDDLDEFSSKPVIGKAITNNIAYVLDHNMQPLPVGALGEICISGLGLALGYLNRKDLTNEKFVANPFQSGAKIYRTGDLGQLLSDGNIAIYGRKDGQVKVNGYRIEVQEITQSISELEGISDAAVRVIESDFGDSKLVAYCVGESLDLDAVKQSLRKKLPDYMIPTAFVEADRIPFTSNGKLDVNALPAIDGLTGDSKSYKEPETSVEKELHEIWSDVLEQQKISVTDNFFALGGDSIKAVRLVGMVSTVMGYPIEVKDIFEYPDIASLAHFLDNEIELNSRLKYIEDAEIHLQEFKQDVLNQKSLRDSLPKGYEDFFPMSDIQVGMLYHGFIKPEEGVYHQEKFSQFRDASFDPQLFEKSLQMMATKHPMLRTSFDINNFEVPIQVVHSVDELNLPLTYKDYSKYEVEEAIENLQKLKQEDLSKPYGVEKEVLWRLYLIKLSEEEFGVLFSYHHAILDGWSEASFYAELSNCYFSLKENSNHALEQLQADYKDYVIAQLGSKRNDEVRDFWTSFMEGYERTYLPFQKQVNDLASREQSVSRPFVLGSEKVAKLDELAAKHNMHIKQVFLAAYMYLLKVTTGKNDITIGLVTNARPEKVDGDKVLGCFLNTIPFRYRFNDESISDYIQNIGKLVSNLRNYDKFPLPDILKAIGEESGSHNPIYDNRFDYVDFYIDKTAHAETEVSKPLIQGRGNSDHRFSLNIRRNDDEVAVRFFYLNDLYSVEEITRIENYYQNIIEGFLSFADNEILGAETVLGDEEVNDLKRSTLLEVDYPKEQLIHTLFEKEQLANKDKVAVKFGEKELTYDLLNRQSNQLANYLRNEVGVKPNDLVGVMVERSEMIPVFIMGVLKSGAGYVPVDPDHPIDRNAYILNDADVKIVISDGKSEHVEKQLGLEVINLVDIEDQLGAYSDENPEVVNNVSDAAYVIYTSGSTGMPKGVVVEHENVVRLLFNEAFQFDFSKNDTWTLFHSICFDFSVWEMFGALLLGGKLVGVSKDIAKNPEAFVQLLIDDRVTVLNQIPTMFDHVVSEVRARGLNEIDLRYVIFGGAALKPEKLNWWVKNFPHVQMINMYGITETTVHVTFKKVDQDLIKKGRSNIGKPIPTLHAYIVDDQQRLMPVGVPGEIAVKGAGVTRGYLNRPDLTHERFVSDPYSPTERMYLSGDLGFIDENGDIIYLGRKDSQVKIRGFRIEIGEIENAILKEEVIQEAIVLLSDDNEDDKKELIAYVVSQAELDTDFLRQSLLERLPEYMVPAHFVKLEEFPLTANKKVDLKALKKLDVSRLSTSSDFVEPTNELQEKLVDLWKDELRADQIGIKDNFFSLGGDSLKAIRLISKINKHTDLTLKIADLFTYPTIEEISGLQADSTTESLEDQRLHGLNHIKQFKERLLSDKNQCERLPEDWEDIYPMTPIENGMIYSSILNEEHPVYYDQFTYKLSIKDFDKFKNACELLVQRHDILRTSYYLGTFNEPTKVVNKSIEIPMTMQDISSMSAAEQHIVLKNFLKEDLSKRLSFEGEILWHMKIFKLSGSNYFLVWNFHHSILDGWSISQFKIELSKLLSTAGKPDLETLEPLAHDYRDYCAIVLGRAVSGKTQKFWKDQLDDYTQNKLPFNYSGKIKSDEIGAKITQTLVAEETLEALEQLSEKHEVSFKSICMAAHIYLLHIITSEDDVVTGVVSHDRQAIQDGDKILGCFLNTVPLRVKVREAKNNLSLIKQVEKLMAQTREHEIHLTDIAKIIGEKTSEGNPIFDTILNYTDFHVLETWSENKNLSRKADAVGVTKGLKGAEMTNTLFDVEVSKTLGRFTARIKYRSSYFEDDDVQKALTLYVRILEQFAASPEEVINTESLLLKDEFEEIVYKFNDTIRPYSYEKGLHQLFESQVVDSPDNVAIRDNGSSITYADLNNKANQLARKLIRDGVEVGNNIGLVTARNQNMIVGMLAILKAGGAYVPVDPEYPITRQSYILENSSVSKVLLDDAYEIEKESVQFSFTHINADLSSYSTDNLDVQVDTTSLAYTIYTSGSTGKPKGVMIEHRSAVNLVEWVNNTFNVNENDKLLFVTSMCFDLSVYDIFGMLASGGSIVMAKKEDVENFPMLKGLLQREKITFWDSVPTTMNYLVNELEHEGDFEQSDLRVVFMSGDWIPTNLPQRILKPFPKAEVISLGGATEGTVWSNYYPVKKDKTYKVSIPYGKPITNNFFYILDADLNPVPKGVVGELFIGGIGVARGYANDEVKTNAAFVDDPFNKTLGGRMYRTGDLGRIAPDGNMEFLGRKDHQTKIRGYRVELGEIQSLLVKNTDIKEAVVEVLKDANNDNFLCAYIVFKEECSVDAVKDYLSNALPTYMIPSHFMVLDALPLNSNGKVDRKKLPEPNVEEGHAQAYEKPRNELEEKLCDLMSEILGNKQVGISENFLDLGAHSLNISSFVNRVHRQLGIELSIRDVFTYPTVKGISEIIDGKDKTVYREIDTIEEQDYYNTTHAQKRFWFLQQVEDNQVAYNMPSAYKLEGSVDVKALSDSFSDLIKRHESLRTTFVQVNGELKQKVNQYESSGYEVAVLDLKEEKNSEEVARSWAEKMAKVNFDLKEGPLVQTMIIELSEKEYVLLFSLHHIISDGWSKGVFLDELIKLYDSHLEENKLELEKLNIQYKDYAAWQNEVLNADGLSKHREFWTSQFEVMPPAINLPYDFKRPEANSYKGGEIGTILDQALTEKLNELAKEQDASLFMLLLALLNTLLNRVTGQSDFVIGTPVAGRDQSDLDKQIGLFLNTLALRNTFDSEASFNDLLSSVKENVLKGFEHQTYPFDLLINDLNLNRETGKIPLFNVWMVLQNMGDDGAEAKPVETDGLKVKRFGNDFNVSRYDLRFTFNETSKGLMIGLNYSADLFKKETAQAMLGLFEKLLSDVTDHSHLSIESFKSLSKPQSSLGEKQKTSGLVKRSRRKSATPSDALVTTSILDNQTLPTVIKPVNRDVDLAKWVESNRGKVEEMLLKQGALLFRDFSIDNVVDFEKVVGAYQKDLLNYDFASTPRTKIQGKVYTSTEYPSDQEILMHNEMAYTKHYPDELWFYCDLPATEGGETPILDSHLIYNKLDKDIKAKFEKEKLMYVRYYHNKLDLSWQKAFQTDNKAQVEEYCDKHGVDYEWITDDLLKTSEICDAVIKHPKTGRDLWFNQAHLFHVSSMDSELRKQITDLVGNQYPRNVYYGNGEEISDKDLMHIKQVMAESRVLFPWKKGDVLMVDNLAVAHGRMPYKGDRKIIVAMTK